MTMTMKSCTFHELQEPEQAWRQERLRFDQGVIFDAVTAGECKTPFGLHCERKNAVQARKVAYQKSRGRSDHAIGVVRSSDAETAVRIYPRSSIWHGRVRQGLSPPSHKGRERESGRVNTVKEYGLRYRDVPLVTGIDSVSGRRAPDCTCAKKLRPWNSDAKRPCSWNEDDDSTSSSSESEPEYTAPRRRRPYLALASPIQAARSELVSENNMRPDSERELAAQLQEKGATAKAERTEDVTWDCSISLERAMAHFRQQTREIRDLKQQLDEKDQQCAQMMAELVYYREAKFGQQPPNHAYDPETPGAVTKAAHQQAFHERHKPDHSATLGSRMNCGSARCPGCIPQICLSFLRHQSCRHQNSCHRIHVESIEQLRDSRPAVNVHVTDAMRLQAWEQLQPLPDVDDRGRNSKRHRSPLAELEASQENNAYTGPAA